MPRARNWAEERESTHGARDGPAKGRRKLCDCYSLVNGALSQASPSLTLLRVCLTILA